MTERTKAGLPEKLTVWCNHCDPNKESFAKSFMELSKRGVDVRLISTNGPYTVWVRGKYGRRYYGPTAVKCFLSKVV